MTENQKKSEKKIYVSYEMPISSKGELMRYFTERFTYRVGNVLVPRPIEIEGVAPHVLRSSVNLRIFGEDLVETEEALQNFFLAAPGVDAATRELLSGIYKSHGRDLRIKVNGLAKKDSWRNRMPLYVVDPARKDGKTQFTQHLNMNELINAHSGGDTFDRIMRRGRAPIQGMRVGKRVSGTGVDGVNVEARVSYTGYLLVYLPSQPTVDLEEGTASFNGLNELGCAVYVPMSLIGFMINLFYKKLEPRWREMIGNEHELVDAESRGERRLQLTSGQVAQKPRKPEGEPKPKRDRKARKDKDKAEAAKPEGEAEAKPEGEDADHESATTAEA